MSEKEARENDVNNCEMKGYFPSKKTSNLDVFVNEGNMDLHKNGHPQPFMYMLSNKHRHGVIIFVHSRPAILNQFSICFTFYSKTINKSFRMDMVHNNVHRTRSVFIKSIDGLTSTALALSLSTTSPQYYNFIRINSPNTTLK